MATVEPWHQVTMARLAGAAGVSRQTVYNEFGSKQGLARAVGLVVASRVLADFERAVESAGDDLELALRDGLIAAFRSADRIPLVHAVLSGESGEDGLMTVVTTDAASILELAGGVVASLVAKRWPDLEPAAVDAAADAAIRLVVSNLLEPGGSREDTARRIAWLCASAVRAGAS